MRPRKIDRVAYYADGVAADIAPFAMLRRGKDRIFGKLATESLPQAIVDRVNYYNKLTPGQSLETRTKVRSIPRNQSYYFYDLMPLAKPFGLDLHIATLFGDITAIPEQPSIVKSRPVAGDNANSVVMKLDSLRHFTVAQDPFSFDEKLPSAVWRGWVGGLPHRQALVRGWEQDRRHDIGHVDNKADKTAGKPFLDPVQQMRHRYIVSVEGVDVATNLKWVLSSNSLCLMPRPRYETWFMEGRLQPGVHYAELRPDFEDLDEKVGYYERHPQEAREIVANANAHWRMFLDKPMEKLVSLLVLQKYFEATGQIEPGPFSRSFFRSGIS